MIRRHSVSTLGILLVMCFLFTADHVAAAYSFTDINFPGAAWTVASDISDSGQIVGYYSDTSGVRHGFLLSSGTYTTIDCPSPYTAQSLANGVNDGGQIVGYCAAPGGINGNYGTTQSFLLSGGVLTFLPDVPGSYNGASTFAEAINDTGQIVGWYADSCLCKGHGFLLSAGTYTTIDAPGFATSVALGINDSGQVSGTTDPGFGSGSEHGFLLSHGGYTIIDDPDASTNSATSAQRINNSGTVVGYFFSNGGAIAHGFLWDGGAFTTIDHPNAPSSIASGINSLGQIVGAYSDFTNVTHGFVTAAPEPPSITSVTAAPDSLSPPNHKMVPVSLDVSVTNGNPSGCRISAISSNESPAAPGESDWLITGPLTANLRAERAGFGKGRVYTITVTCTNTSNLSASKTVAVNVPHDRSQ